MRRAARIAAAALAVQAALAIQVALSMGGVGAAPRKIFVFPIDGSADAPTRARLGVDVQRLARGLDGHVSTGGTTFADAAMAVGCDPAAAACAAQVIDSLAVDEIVWGTATKDGPQTRLVVHRASKGAPPRDATAIVAAQDHADAGIGALFGARTAPSAAPPSAQTAAPTSAQTATAPSTTHATAPAPAPAAAHAGAQTPATATTHTSAPAPAPTAARAGAQAPTPATTHATAPVPAPAAARAGAQAPTTTTTHASASAPAPAPAAVPSAAAAAAAAAPTREPAPASTHFGATARTDGPDSNRALGISAIAGGGVAVALGLLLWHSESDLQDQIDRHATATRADFDDLTRLEDRAGRDAIVGDVLVVAGVAAAGVGGWILYRDSRRDARDHRDRHGTALRVAPHPIAHGVGLTLTFGAAP